MPVDLTYQVVHGLVDPLCAVQLLTVKPLKLHQENEGYVHVEIKCLNTSGVVVKKNAGFSVCQQQNTAGLDEAILLKVTTLLSGLSHLVAVCGYS